MAKFKFTNDFHNTTAYCISEDGVLSKDQVRRLRRKLCPSKGCQCGGVVGERGPGNPIIDVEFKWSNWHGRDVESYRIVDSIEDILGPPIDE